ncbi:MAG: PEP-CTERM sorting domain-containing protein [Bryobacteraceae bacterium]
MIINLKYGILSVGLLAASLNGATLTNGGFESGLTGWTVTGNVFPSVSPTTGLVNVLGGADWTGFSPQEGNFYAELSNAPSVNNPPIQDFSMISTGPYFVLPGSNGTIDFVYNLLTNEFDNGLDYAEFRINGFLVQKYLVSDISQAGGCTVNSAPPDGSSLCVESGWINQSFSLAPYEGQNVTFSFGIYDDFTRDPQGDPFQTADNQFDSVLLLDGISATGLAEAGVPQVPEPSTLLLTAGGIAAAFLARRRAKA